MTLNLLEITLQNRHAVEHNASSLDEATASLPPGFYTTFSTLNGGTKVLGLQAHLDRLYVPAKELRLQPAVDENTLRKHIVDIARMNLPRESRMRLILTKDQGRIYIGAQPFIAPPKEIYQNGVHVITSTVSRSDPRIKGTDFITKSAEQRKQVKGDIYEILLVHNGKILEGMTSNFYAVRGKTLITAQKGILLGVTRRAVLRIARGQGMSIEYHSPLVDEKIDEAFLTSSSRGVVPIVMIDGTPVGQGRVGAWAKRLSLAYQAYVEERSERIT
jgi:branched-chain amino acid aminotransferase